MPVFNADDVAKKAKELLAQNKNSIEDARLLYLEEIMDWSDYYTENSTTQSANELKRTHDAIVSLWLQFTAFEISLHQFKKAVEIFDKAINDPIANKSMRIFQTYANYCIDRNKPSNAQKIYIKALCAGFSDTENSLLWKEFLDLMHKVNKSNDLTIEQLYAAVKNQKSSSVGNLAVPTIMQQEVQITNNLANGTISNDTHTAAEAPTAVSGVPDTIITSQEMVDSSHLTALTARERKPVDKISLPLSTSSNVDISIKNETDVVNKVPAPVVGSNALLAVNDVAIKQEEGSPAPEIEALALTPDSLDDVSGMTPEVIVKVFSNKAPMLFTAPNKEPTASGLAALGQPDKDELEAYLGCSLTEVSNRENSSVKSPTAMKVGTNGSSNSSSDGVNSASRSSKFQKIMDFVEAMWSAQALKERHFDAWIANLRDLHESQEASLQKKLESKLSDSTDKGSFTSSDQRIELLRFHNRCAVQRELLHAIIHKALFALLIEQQTLLAKIGFPRFSLAFVRKLEAYVHNRKANVGTIKLDANVAFDIPLAVEIESQRKLLCALMSIRLQTVATQRSRLQTQSRHKLQREHSGSLTSSATVPGAGGPHSGQDGRPRSIKKRRIITEHYSDFYGASAASHGYPGTVPFHNGSYGPQRRYNNSYYDAGRHPWDDGRGIESGFGPMEVGTGGVGDGYYTDMYPGDIMYHGDRGIGGMEARSMAIPPYMQVGPRSAGTI